MAFNRFKKPRLGLGLGLPIAPFGAFRTLRLHLYMLPHDYLMRYIVTSPIYDFVNISMLRGVLRVRIGCYLSMRELTIMNFELLGRKFEARCVRTAPPMNGAMENALFGSSSPPSSPSGPSERGHSSSSPSRLRRDRSSHDAPIPNDVSVTTEGGGDHGDHSVASRGDQEASREARSYESGAATQSSRSEQADDDTVSVNRSVRQSAFRQTTLGPSLPRHPTSPLPLPLLPNLAQAALERLARSSADGDESMDDFRPLKKRKVTSDTAQGGEEGDEVSKIFILTEVSYFPPLLPLSLPPSLPLSLPPSLPPSLSPFLSLCLLSPF